ncbi:MAG: spore protease YyaC [Clostridiales bacterium]|jgi:putative sporulation protein YyaC|nr:spore protease YyaC [Clostridiales bacterium]
MILSGRNEISYINTSNETAVGEFRENFGARLRARHKGEEIIILCIGTDRVTGDSLGPLVGYKLKNSVDVFHNVKLYGTLEMPVHAKNISETIERIYNSHSNPLVVAVDACLGRLEHIGYVTVGLGAVKPGAGLNYDLPAVGDVYVMGIVNTFGAMDAYLLQNTRLGLVMRMADVVYHGIMLSMRELFL